MSVLYPFLKVINTNIIIYLFVLIVLLFSLFNPTTLTLRGTNIYINTHATAKRKNSNISRVTLSRTALFVIADYKWEYCKGSY